MMKSNADRFKQKWIVRWMINTVAQLVLNRYSWCHPKHLRITLCPVNLKCFGGNFAKF